MKQWTAPAERVKLATQGRNGVRNSVRGVIGRAGTPVLALAAAAAAVLVLAIVLLWQSNAARQLQVKAEATEIAAEEIMLNGLTVLHAMTYAESAQRGFLLTEKADQLALFAPSKMRVGEAMDALDRVASGDARYAGMLAEVHARVTRRLEVMDRTIELAQAGRRDEALDLLPTGRRLQADARDSIGRLVRDARAHSAEMRMARLSFDRRAVLLQAALAVLTMTSLLIAIGAIVLERASTRRAAAAIGAERRRAQEADRAKSRFLAAASHDMRQPLHALALYISALERRIDSDQGREILGNMEGAVRSMSRMFTALLDLARLEAGILRPEPMAFQIQGLLEDVVEQAVDPRGGKAQVRVAPTDLWVNSDPDLLEIAIRNLVSNAVKHSKGGRVLVGCRRVDGFVRIEVHDDGRGMPPEMLDTMFAEFVRGEAAQSTEGVGLGLAIVERMAKLLGHGLSVSSTLNRGTVFCITAPRAAPGGVDAAAVADHGPNASTALAGRRVLVADDEPLALDAMRQVLEDAGAIVTTADSAAAVRAHAREAFDLYVFDLNLERESGLRLIGEIERARGRIPALIVTGATTPDLLEELRAAGRPWLTKPIQADALIAAARRLQPVAV